MKLIRMEEKDEQNISSVTATQKVDRMNAEFYGKFPYPWRPFKLDRILDSDFSRKMLCQALGDWTHTIIPQRPEMWVAGCGTNQALITALNFPAARVVGSDISRPSLDLCTSAAQDLSVCNLDLHEESLNDCTYREAFDYILCTGVVHHNAQPAETLRRLARALRPGGVLELMVYNRFHRILNSAFQKAVRTLSAADSGGYDSATELEVATALVDDFPAKCLMQAFLEPFKQTRREHVQHFADCLIEPVEYSYTVETLNDLAQTCGLELLSPAVCLFDRVNGGFAWNLRFNSPELNRRYYALDDIQRWQVTNLLLCESSPMLWFYLRRSDSPWPRRSEREICEEFLETNFTRARSRRQSYILTDAGHYRQCEGSSGYPGPLGEGVLAEVLTATSGSIKMREILEQQERSWSFPEINDSRLRLTTPAFPYLKANSL